MMFVIFYFLYFYTKVLSDNDARYCSSHYKYGERICWKLVVILHTNMMSSKDLLAAAILLFGLTAITHGKITGWTEVSVRFNDVRLF